MYKVDEECNDVRKVTGIVAYLELDNDQEGGHGEIDDPGMS